MHGERKAHDRSHGLEEPKTSLGCRATASEHDAGEPSKQRSSLTDNWDFEGRSGGRWRASPMQLPTQGQWWSNLRTQLSQIAQCEQRGGR